MIAKEKGRLKEYRRTIKCRNLESIESKRVWEAQKL